MTGAEFGGLAVLGLIDGTSFGTLVIPLWMTAAAPHSSRRVIEYLGVLLAFYWLIGVTVVVTGGAVVSMLSRMPLAPWWGWAQLAVGSIVLIAGFAVDRTASRRERPSPRTERWRQRVVRAQGRHGTTALALAAGLIEVGSMAPYLAALGMLIRSDLPVTASAALLLGYAALMIAPFLVIIGGRHLARGSAARLLTSVERRITQASEALLGTVLIIVGALIASDAAFQVGILPF